MVRIFVLLLTLVAQDLEKPLPEVQPFLAEFRKTLRRDRTLLSQYTFTEKETEIQLDSNGKPKKTEVNVYQVFPGIDQELTYRRHILKDGVPTPAKELEKDDKEHQKKVAEAERKRGKTTPQDFERKRAKEEAEDKKIIDEVFAMYDVRIVGREDISGHPTILLTYKPRLTYKPKTSEGKILQHIAGRAWVSELDHELVRIEGEVVDTVSLGFGMFRVHKGTRVFAERRKVNDEVWLPARTELTGSARVLLLKGLRIRQVTEYSDHRKFNVETILKFPDLESEKE